MPKTKHHKYCCRCNANGGKDQIKFSRFIAGSYAWKVEDGTLSVDNHSKSQDIITREVYADLNLRFDFKLTYGANSGTKYFVANIKDSASDTMQAFRTLAERRKSC